MGKFMTHSGGYPGFGSDLMLLPDAGLAVFAFANRTYAAPRASVRMAGLQLAAANMTKARAVKTNKSLESAYAAIGAMYKAGSLKPGMDKLAMNFVLDRSAENWAKRLAGFSTKSGKCETGSPLTATGGLYGFFSWDCEKENIEGNVLLAPTKAAAIQEWRLRVVPVKE